MYKYKKSRSLPKADKDRVPVSPQAGKSMGVVDKNRGQSDMAKIHGGVSRQIKKKDGSWYGKEKGIPLGLMRSKKKKKLFKIKKRK